MGFIEQYGKTLFCGLHAANMALALVSLFRVYRELFHIVSIALYLYISYLTNRRVGITKALLKDYSIHIAITSIVFLLTKISPGPWAIFHLMASGYQVWTHISLSQSQTPVAQKLRALYQKYGSSELIRALLALMEISTAPMIMTVSNATDRRYLVIISVFYLFWMVLYRYATDAVSRQLWEAYYKGIREKIYKLPVNVANILIKVPDAFASLGAIARRIY